MANTDDARARANESMENNLIRSESRIFASYGVVGAILLFGAGGYLLDRWLDTGPWLLLLGLLMGLSIGFFELVRAARQH
jgi:F0F1-type ATP synthase assembly protein I